MWILALLLIIIFFVLSAFFSGMETGLISIDRFRLEQEAKQDKNKKKILEFLEHPDKIFGTTLIGTNISLVIVSSLTIYLIHHFEKENFETIGTLILAGLLLVFAEIIPKALYRDFSNKIVPQSFPLVRFFYLVLKPFVRLVSYLDTFLAKLFKLPGKEKFHLLTREELTDILSEAEEDGTLQEDQREMLEEALEFTELKAENVMIHRTEIIALAKDTPIEKVIAVAKKEGFTRFPVYGEDLDEILGILIIYDLLKKSPRNKKNLFAIDFVREAYFAPETMDVDKLLTEMQTNKNSMAIIVDSFGGTAGIVTIEDILEEIVGEIEDEYDSTSEEVEKINENTFLIQGFVEIDYLNDEFGMDLPEGDYETIAGLIIDKLARIPTRKTKFSIGSWDGEIKQVTDKKIVKVKLMKKGDGRKETGDKK